MPAVYLEEGHFRVLGKGSKERIVPIGVSLQKALWKYMNRYRPEPAHPNVTVLFLSRNGRALAARSVYCRIRQYGEKGGLVGVRCSPHTFRHTFAISYLRNGGDVSSLQRMLGHSSLEVVRIYVNMCRADIKECHRRFSPADNLASK